MNDSAKQLTNAEIETIVAQAQEGDIAAFSQLYELLVEPLYRFVLLRIGNEHDAQDITAETFKRVWQNLARYRTKNFRAFVFTIARNVTVDWIRKNKRNIPLDSNDHIVDTQVNLLEETQHKDTITELMAAIQRLPQPYQEVIILRYIEEMTIKETAAILQKSPIAVRVTQHRAIKKLKQILT